MMVNPPKVTLRHIMSVYFGVDEHDLRYVEVEDDMTSTCCM